MRKGKWKKWLIGTAITVVILAIGAFFVMDYAVDRMLRSIASGMESDNEPKSTDGSPTPTTAPSPSGEDQGAEASENTLHPSEQEEGKATPPSEQNGLTTEPTPAADQSKSPSPTSQAPNPKASAKEDASISQEKAAQAQEQITIQDKTKVTSVLLKRLDSSDIKTVMDLASGGMSVEEKREAKKIILEKLTEEEYNELISIASKLGLSNGKDYDKSKQELAPEK